MSATLSRVEVPDIGDFDDVPVIEILVAAGDTVAAEDPLVTLESDKATMDVPAPFAGVVHELSVELGDRVSQGTVLMSIEPADDRSAPPQATAPTPEPQVDEAPAEAAEPEAESPTASSSATERRGAPSAPDVPAAPDVSDAPDAPDAPTAADPPAAPGAAGNGNGGPIYASPSVRRLARELGVQLNGVSGTGRKGRITKADVQGRANGGSETRSGGPAPGAGSATGLDLAPWPQIDFSRFGEVERVPRTRIQRISGPNLARNWVMIPHVTHNDEADITDLEAWRKELNTEHAGDGVKVTMVSFLVLACVSTLKEFVTLNASLDGDDLIVKRYYNIGFAADTPGGLVVPVIRGADEKGLVEIAQELTTLSGKAREGKLSPAEMSGSTFTISSLGGIGGTSFTPIINAPEVAILGVTRSAIRPVWDAVTGSFVPRLMLPLSLSYDHRVIDGALAARFTAHLAGVLTDLRRTLL
jgi:pyruvate dehydrogenase E2 component (dihydrolipoamide acetyltransferase)